MNLVKTKSQFKYSIFRITNFCKQELLAFGVLLISNSYFSQSFTQEEKKVFLSEKVVFFGYDFSHFKLAEIKRLHEPNQKKYIPDWIDFLNQRRDERSYEKRLQKYEVVFDFDYTLESMRKYDESEMIVISKHILHRESLQTIIDSVWSKKHTYGIGFITIVECFEKQSKTASAYFVFFDILSKEILMVDYYARKGADGYGMKNYWGTGMSEIITHYLADVYEKNLKRFNRGKTRKKPSKYEIVN
jgi:hypothetical protein